MKTRTRSLGLACAVLTCAGLTLACADEAVWPELESPAAPLPGEDGWAVGAPAQHGFQADRIALMDELLRARRMGGVDALLIARGGTLVYEGYFAEGTGQDEIHLLASTTKSVVSLLVGAAVGEGRLEGSGQSIADVFPEHADVFQGEPEKREVTLAHVLTMTAGLEWDQEAVGDRNQDGWYVRTAQDAVRYVLERPLVAEPGREFLYSGGCSLLLAGAVRNATGLQADAYADEALFGPMGIEEYTWVHIDDGLVDADGGLYMRGRDFLKLGQLVLQQGVWEGEQLVPADWIAESTRAHTDSDYAPARYGYQWWLYDLPRSDGSVEPDGVIVASGYGGQKLFVMPSLDLVVAAFGCTGLGYDCGLAHDSPELVLFNWVLKSLEGIW